MLEACKRLSPSWSALSGCCGVANFQPPATCSVGGAFCDGSGSCVECLNTGACSVTGTKCATPTCKGGMCGVASAAKGAACNDHGGTSCDGSGNCVCDVAMQYEAVLTNPKPRGLIRSAGTFGPWDADDPADTPLGGDYVLEHADLGVFQGIAGILESKGHFDGTLDAVATSRLRG